MTAGIPGTGIGGIFYFTAAILLPLRAVARGGRVRFRTRFGRAIAQAAIALAMLAGIWATGWFLGLVFGPVLTNGLAGDQHFFEHHRGNLIRWAVFLASYLTLGFLMTAVHAAKYVLRRKRAAERRALPAAPPEAPRVIRPRARASSENEAAA